MQISVVTPSYNQALYLERTVLSVLGQHNAEFEYIVVDGMSNDESPEILARYSDRLDHLIIERDSGQADAIRKGFQLSRGDILAYLNSDDILLPGTLEFVTNFFESNPEVDAIYGNRVFLDESDHVTRFWVLPPHSSYCMSRWDFIPQETCFWRRSLMERAGPIDPSYSFALDYDLFTRMMLHGRFVRVNRFFAGFRVHENAKSSTLYESVGRREVDRVRQERGIRIRWYDTLVKHLFGGFILSYSWLFKQLRLRAIQRRTKLPWQPE